jgi:uncharacterized protein YkwD
MEGEFVGRFLSLIAVLFVLYLSWPLIDKQLENTEYGQVIDNIQVETSNLKDTFQTVYTDVQQLLTQLGFDLKDPSLKNPENEPKEKVELKTPTEQIFSIHNFQLGDAKEEIESNLGAAKRISENEYGTNWYSYHQDYHNFFMVMYDEKNKAAGLYTNQELIASSKGIQMGSTKESVRATLGEPITEIQKGLVVYQFQENKDYDIFHLDDSYVTIFYDIHENNTVTAIQLVRKELEEQKRNFYTKSSPELKEGFEFQMFDLTNAARIHHQLPILTWDDHVRETARKHSTDMAVNNYFDHQNLQGQSPFDRMKEDDIIFSLAGENLAYGQFSSIFAHEGLMNSLGHRKNILQKGFKYLGVGVAFNQESHPYYTQNYYSK